MIKMYKILIIDDDVTKIHTILEEFKDELDNRTISIDYELEVKKAISQLEQQYFDLLILDIQLPSLGDLKSTSERGGIDLLHVVENMDRVKKPSAIIGLTAYDEKYDENFEEFRKSLWVLIKYRRDEREWLNKIREKVLYFIKAKMDLIKDNQIDNKCDCAIIVAVQTEFEAVKNCGLDWKPVENINDSTKYYKTITESGKNLVLARQHQMGMVAASLLTEKLINHFKPSLVCMLGIAAGREGEVKLGDIIIVNESWDYGSGKIKSSSDGHSYILEPEPHQLAIDINLKEYFLLDFDDKLYRIRKDWNNGHGKRIDTDIKLHIGALASGAAVLQSEDVVTEFIQPQNRKVLGIDMETYAVYYAAINATQSSKFLSIKAVCDFANQYKNDNYQDYAAFVSTQFFVRVLDDVLARV